MKKATLILLSLSITLTAGWWRTYGGTFQDLGLSIQSTGDDAYIITGWTLSFGQQAHDNVWLLKVDNDGDTLWSRICAPGKGYSVQQASDGGYIVAGYPKSLIKTDSNGDTSWTRSYDGKGNCVQVSTAGGYIVGGAKPKVEGSSGGAWLLKVDSIGDTIWSRTYGEVGFGEFLYLQETSDNGFIITGNVSANTPWGALGVMRTDSMGDTLWTYRYIVGNIAVGYCVKETKDGGYAVTGITGEKDEWGGWVSGAAVLLKLDSQGNELWCDTFQGGWGCYVQETDDSCLVLTGYGIELIKVDASGNLIWHRIYGPYDGGYSAWGRSFVETKEGGYLITGYTDTESSGLGNYDLCLIKTDSLGLLGVEEQQPVAEAPEFETLSSIGSEVTLRFTNQSSVPLTLNVFDASGRKVDEIRSTQTQGTITWGQGFNPGVYFIRVMGERCRTHKVVLVR